MSATDPKTSLLSNLQPSQTQSNCVNNQDNKGIIGHGSRNNVVIGNDNLTIINNNQVTKTDGVTELDGLMHPHISKDALHDYLHSPPECHPGTRTTVLEGIVKWMSDSTASPLLWVHGPAGIGKSVIAKTISMNQAWVNQTRVVATFFFSTSSDKDGATLFSTLAWQLAKNVPETEQHIIAALKRNPSLQTSQLDQQFLQLIDQPLKKCNLKLMVDLVMVIDGVDECVNETMQEQFLDILKCAGRKMDLPLRFLICSRPEPCLRAILEEKPRALAKSASPDSPQTSPDLPQASPEFPQSSSAAHPVHTSQSEITITSPTQQLLSLRHRAWVLIKPYLPDITQPTARLNSALQWRPRWPIVLPSDASKLYKPMRRGVDKAYTSEIDDELDKIRRYPVISRIKLGFSEESKADIAKYLTYKFIEAISRSETDTVTSTDITVTSTDIDDLVSKSCGQFLYASTIARLLDNPSWSPERVLKMARSSSLPSPSLDKLYSEILDQARLLVTQSGPREVGGSNAKTELMTLTDVLAILVVLWENMQFASIPESIPVIRYLLLLERGVLELKLQKMHSILCVIPGKSVRVYHRSFFEFLQCRDKSKEHHIAYSIALRRFLALLSRAALGHAFRCYAGQLQ